MKQFFYFIISFFIFSSCVKNNPDPAWLEVTEWTLLSNAELSGQEGELSQNFSDAWVYIDDKIVGVFEVPFKIPILAEGNVNIKIYPAIRNNGISATKKIYPFAQLFELNATLVKNQTLTINPTTKYYGETNFWIEDFENVTLAIEDDPVSQANIVKDNDPLILEWGNYYGKVELTSLDSIWVAYTSGAMYLPRGQEVYMEVDYYNTNNLITGVIGISSSSIVNNQNIQLNDQKPEEVKWKKIYIDLKEIITNSPNAEYFKMSFQALLDEGDSQGVIIMDNIKVVHF